MKHHTIRIAKHLLQTFQKISSHEARALVRIPALVPVLIQHQMITLTVHDITLGHHDRHCQTFTFTPSVPLRLLCISDTTPRSIVVFQGACQRCTYLVNPTRVAELGPSEQPAARWCDTRAISARRSSDMTPLPSDVITREHHDYKHRSRDLDQPKPMPTDSPAC